MGHHTPDPDCLPACLLVSYHYYCLRVPLQDWLPEYFTSRDVTLNEVLILKQSPDKAVFYYTRDALRDAQLQRVRRDVRQGP